MNTVGANNCGEDGGGGGGGVAILRFGRPKRGGTVDLDVTGLGGAGGSKNWPKSLDVICLWSLMDNKHSLMELQEIPLLFSYVSTSSLFIEYLYLIFA